MTSTSSNTAVVSIASFPPDWKPETLDFFYRSADRVGIQPIMFKRDSHEDSYTGKVTQMEPDIFSLDSKWEYILYVDARDLIFVRGLQDICDAFNRVGWPMVMSAGKTCNPHVDPGWAARFGTHHTKNNFLNAGIWMAERKLVEKSFAVLRQARQMVLDGLVPSAEKSLLWSDQMVWQVVYLEKMLPMRLDHERNIFCNFHSQFRYIGDTLDLKKCGGENPLVTNTGSTPCIAHFPGSASQMIQFFYQCLVYDLLKIE